MTERERCPRCTSPWADGFGCTWPWCYNFGVEADEEEDDD